MLFYMTAPDDPRRGRTPKSQPCKTGNTDIVKVGTQGSELSEGDPVKLYTRPCKTVYKRTSKKCLQSQ